MRNASTIIRRIVLWLLLPAALLTACGAEAPREDGPVVIQYWEKWTGFEKEAMREIVDAYNNSQDRVFVNFVSQSELDRKLLFATSGGNPPDVAGFWSNRLASFVEMGTLTPLDGRMRESGIERDDYLPAIINCGTMRGFVWGLPTTPATLALHYNQGMFRDSGLDPEQPPATLQELDEFAERLAVMNDGRYERVGFLPTEPNWWLPMWGFWFGDSFVSEDGRTLTCDSPESVAALRWLASYTTNYNHRALRELEAAHANQFASASNAFMSERVGMMLQGVWMANFIKEYGPDVEWSAAPFPAAFETNGHPVTIIETDLLVIPVGAHHPDEAWEFIRFVQRQENLEQLCLAQRKFSPLAEVSESFYTEHTNPHIELFRQLAESDNARFAPQTPIWSQYSDELTYAYQMVWTNPGAVDPEDLLRGVKDRVQPLLDAANLRWDRVAEVRQKEWAAQ